MGLFKRKRFYGWDSNGNEITEDEHALGIFELIDTHKDRGSLKHAKKCPACGAKCIKGICQNRKCKA